MRPTCKQTFVNITVILQNMTEHAPNKVSKACENMVPTWYYNHWKINKKYINKALKQRSTNGAKMEPKRLPRRSQKHIYIVHPYLLLSAASWGPFWQPTGTPLDSIFHTFWSCFLRSCFEGLWDSMFIDFGTMLASMLAHFWYFFRPLDLVTNWSPLERELNYWGSEGLMFHTFPLSFSDLVSRP